jgi:hypothetical protein
VIQNTRQRILLHRQGREILGWTHFGLVIAPQRRSKGSVTGSTQVTAVAQEFGAELQQSLPDLGQLLFVERTVGLESLLQLE